MVDLAKRRHSRREMEKIYRRRRIMLSFIAVLLVVLIGYGVFSLVKLFTKSSDTTDAPAQEDQISDSESKSKEKDQSPENKKYKIDINNSDNKEQEVKDENQPLSASTQPNENQDSEVKVQGNSTDWNLILANPDNALPQDFSVETAVVQGAKEVDKRIVDIAKKMLNDAKNEGIDLLVCSGYRAIEKQQNRFDNSVNGYVAQGYSKEDAIKYTKAYYAVPGTSEHHTGLAMDIVTPSYQTLDAKYDQTDAAKWLLNNAYKYGFILRYPKDKENITKIAYEPWHYRYVGEEHAKVIKEKNLCFEEYIKTIN